MNFIQKNGKVKVIKDVNIRKGYPFTTVPIATKFYVGQTIPFVGWVTDGENVLGNAKWYKTVDGNYFWSGNVEEIATKSGTVKVLKDTNVRKGAPSTAVSITRTAHAGETLSFVDVITNGESVSGNAKWYKTETGDYFWSGNVSEVTSPVTPPVVPNGNTLSISLFTAIFPNLASKAELFCGALNTTFGEFGITTLLSQAAFLAQTAHESAGFTLFKENLNYSAQALLTTFPSYFNTTTAAQYERQPEKIANRVYAGRYGNGNEASGDGYRFRGRGVIQITFKDNYAACGLALGLDLISHPELLEETANAFRSAGWYWKSRNINMLAEAADFIGVTKKINGGTNGLDDRLAYYAKIKKAFGIL